MDLYNGMIIKNYQNTCLNFQYKYFIEEELEYGTVRD